MMNQATTIQEEEPFDLMPARRIDAGAPLRRFWTWDFCAHQPPPSSCDGAEPPRMRSATMESHLSGASQDLVVEKDGLEQMLQNAKSALDNFWPKLDADQNLNDSKDDKKAQNRAEMTIASRHISLNTTKPTILAETTTSAEEKEITLSVIVTEPGTSRAMRVYRGLELFLLAIFVLGMTLRLLSQSGVEFNFMLEPKERKSL